MSKDVKNSFCIKPWAHTFIKSNGDYSICCQSAEPRNFNNKTHTLAEFWNSDFVKNVRKEMLDGNRPEICNKCWDYEKNNTTSLRKKTNADYKIIYPYLDKILAHYDYPKNLPVDIECSLSNLCNLKCLMCTGASSSTLLTENKILKIENLNQKEFNAKPDLIKELKEWIATSPKYLTFHGGETMMMPEVKELISWGIKNNLLDNTEIRMITNATKFDSEWADLFSKLKNLTLMVSIDGFDKVNDYIRFGSRWDSVQSAVVEMKKLPNTKLLIHSTLQNLNILTFDKLISWAEEQEIFFNFDMIRPGDFDLNTFPPELLLLAKERLEKHKNFKNAFVSYDSLIKMVDTAIATSTYNTEKWAKFVDIINLRDQHRRTSILNVIPELANYWPDNINTPATLAEENE